ncbi:MAG: phosphoribosylglycinamide formyltransferase [Alphaproteobacteria bacterium]|jgi:phosphoribosylglycinamide formyltransferase 1|nr:phosphoribosylglycinamide formyltransferase [Alphaproteobacteria bacterium]MBT4017458.1 phosphoribosylglycinamide formyltransferase [Alphaproteobacteria bacterium]MBT4966719.1 phosphoribosylglycinamide formyltransferase [Alphaproteobacteria bacterium]MBT5158325.1 phosphoribosylglycinamide formyltransferase [Alphaproteobacteria bacterium]MBT5918966.1 phosphoribosylglycinamide formyltransferase [Alphaproteobacteria bacterium]
MLKVAVLVSGRGSNLQALIDVCAQADFPAEIVTVISNIPDVFALERAAQADIATTVVNHKEFADREAFETALQAAIVQSGAELICLAGFMRILTAGFVNRWRDRLVNIHPSLLPAFKGLHVHEQALEAGVKVSGCTVHFVVPDMDSGPIIVQESVPVLPSDDADALAARILESEHRCYPQALRLIAEGRVEVVGERTAIKEPAK